MSDQALTLPTRSQAQSAIGCVIAAMLVLPAARAALEQSMLRHMLLQAPLLLLAGACLAGGGGPRLRAAVARWNAYGITGLLATAGILSGLMVPRALDLALVVPAIMMAVAGQLYADSPVRICNAYLLDDQTRLGEWLIALAGVAALAWLAQVARTMVLREERVLAAENPPILQN